jgi:hypothetical protein
MEEVEEKLPPDLREKIQERRLQDPYWDVNHLHRFLLERAKIMRTIHGDKTRAVNQEPTKVKTAMTAANKLRQDQRRPPDKGRHQTLAPKCGFCPSTEHWGTACPRYSTLLQRMQRIFELKRCYICLYEHNANAC